ncbi:hypothetical protein OIU85_003994 [Salix viminalis]|uniref:Uncharacterized protein n=1 Tax=Salix viminalis TaxID=40686 RepID=A0A9Q0SXX7_SALVM|nr:hypothetical protein OIU85_003994 [Salix viminalis]
MTSEFFWKDLLAGHMIFIGRIYSYFLLSNLFLLSGKKIMKQKLLVLVAIFLQKCKGIVGLWSQVQVQRAGGAAHGISQWKKEQIDLNFAKLLVEQVSTNYYSNFCYSLATYFQCHTFS